MVHRLPGSAIPRDDSAIPTLGSAHSGRKAKVRGLTTRLMATLESRH